MSDAFSQLADAISAVRKQCGGDPECKVLLSALSTAEDAVSEYTDDADEQPSTLKGAAAKTRQQFAQKRESAPAGEQSSSK